ncbi:hypothetical protein TRFO_12279 [Tritrichomonas foetus]|uniref:HMG box domain-containing protein n=1 Tax=Tritrichomonas foetus TaxID=1144522 RepID=A0A1J4IZF4_9EUKA|nr:hypothetical protein TRFO_12279 [Tritrichomonas foetus]|eukprot:OHS92736.1 hypothetical protein TRFO_12279 [Tritrichomonas foetus]
MYQVNQPYDNTGGANWPQQGMPTAAPTALMDHAGGDGEDEDNSRRPPNAFILFSQVMRSQVRAENPALSNTEVSRILGKMWKEVPNDQKIQYKQRAAQMQEEFKKTHPDYTYRKARRKRALNELLTKSANISNPNDQYAMFMMNNQMPYPPMNGQMPGQMPNQMVGQMGGQMPGQIPGQMSNQMSGQVPGQMMGQMSGLQGQMQNNIQGQMSNQMNGMQGQMGQGNQMVGAMGNQMQNQSMGGQVQSAPMGQGQMQGQMQFGGYQQMPGQSMAPQSMSQGQMPMQQMGMAPMMYGNMQYQGQR